VAIIWRSSDQAGTFEVTEDVEARALKDDPRDPLGELRTLLPGTYAVTQEWEASPVARDAGGSRNLGSFGGRYYIVDVGELLIVPAHCGSFTPEQ
jgi:hypothetical protein